METLEQVEALVSNVIEVLPESSFFSMALAVMRCFFN